MSDTIGLNVGPHGSRPLPARPNLEFEKKRAKKLVRARGGEIALAEAQLMIAREYGFASWRKLLAYYSIWERHQRVGCEFSTPGGEFQGSVRAILREWADRRTLAEQPPDIRMVAAAAAKYIPRFFGLSNQEIFASALTEADAQLIVARRYRFPSWEALIEEQDASVARQASADHSAHAKRVVERQRTRAPGPIRLDDYADGATDSERIARLFEDLPTLARAPRLDVPYDFFTWKLILQAMMGPEADNVRSVVTKIDVDLQPHLNHALLGRPGFGEQTEYVRGLLELGADASWQPENGYSVLDHALLLYHNGTAADMIAVRVAPRRAFWVAAGLGDVAATRAYLRKRGTLTDAARKDRPDMNAIGSMMLDTGRPDASDMEIAWEALLVAGMNSRTHTMQLLLDFGLPVDFTPHAYTMLHVAVAQANIDVVEFLLRSGANPDFKAIPAGDSPLDFASSNFESARDADVRLRIRDILTNASLSKRS